MGATTDRVLDAALARFARQGVRATTMSQLASDVGISRVWLYRLFENRDAVARALLEREGRRFLEGLARVVGAETPLEEAVGAGFEHAIVTLRGHELLRRVLAQEPEMAGAYLTADLGPLLRMASEVVAGFLTDRGLGKADATAVAETLLRLTASIVINNESAIDFDDARARRAYIRRIVPRLVGSS